MAKKGLAALASKQINSTAQPSTPTPHEAAAPETTAANEEVPTQNSTEDKKPGRPAKAPTAPLTVRLDPALLHDLKLRAVMEHTTQTAIIDSLLRSYLNK